MWLGNLISPSTVGALLVAMISAKTHHGRFHERDDCTTQTVVSGDRCGSLASKCGISPSDFAKYNSNPSLCTTLSPGQRVCCSPGTLPDIRPEPQPDGTCASYVVKHGDTCSAIAAANGLKVEDLATFNDKTTWGWSGCNRLVAQLKICLSEGSPPMPQPIDNAVCGPLKPGSQLPTNGQTLADLNPCPLRACCTIWGQCGITPEFCTNATAAATGNPGTASPDQSGCISNCGTDIKYNEAEPRSPISIGYYESWNFDRPCLNMRVDSIDTSKYTHYHWAFATITPTLDISINDTYKQWAKFTGLTGIKRIISIGGWKFSTDPSTAHLFRHATHPRNAPRFAAAVVAFLAAHDLDGVDFDWEYPGDAPDDTTPPPAAGPQPHPSPSPSSSDAHAYLTFLKLLRAQLPPRKTLSLAAPASYALLRRLPPLAQLAEPLDHLVLMAYDLHGQWDYDVDPASDRPRSHVNLTETLWALAAATKAGVRPGKMAVGVAGYGRSFGVVGCADAGCAVEKGPGSTAWAGACTGVRGFLANAEIERVVEAGGEGTRGWFDEGSGSDVVVYGGGTQWVGYMGEGTRRARGELYRRLGFAGTAEWAVDLLRFGGDEGRPWG